MTAHVAKRYRHREAAIGDKRVLRSSPKMTEFTRRISRYQRQSIEHANLICFVHSILGFDCHLRIHRSIQTYNVPTARTY
jgi:hypothetical protein